MVNDLEQIPSKTVVSGVAGPEADLGQTVRGLAPGQRIFRRYTLSKLLGRGGMGVVWLARDDKLDREVALKFVPEMLFLDPAARDDLKRETRRSLELTHPNIVRIYDFMEDESAAAISMEYVDGPTLSHLRVERAAKMFESAEIEPWLGGLCAALDYAHGTARMVHRDLKPANLMLNGRGMVKITDFGIACSLMGSVARVSVYSSSGGTLVYMSPQQMQGDAPSHLDDIYALGATLYELVTGKPPFYAGNISMQVREMVAESMTARRAKLGALGGQIPAAWEETIAACLAKRAEDRPQSAGEILERIHAKPKTFALPYDLTAPTMRFPNAPRPSAASSQEPVLRIPLRTAALAALGLGAVLLIFLLWPSKSVEPAAAPAHPPGADTAAPAAAADAAASPAAAPETPAAGRGGLMIKTVPGGAMVQLGGEAVETTPATFKGINAGKYPVKIILPDYETAEMDVDIKPNEFTDLGTVTLTRSTGSVQITTTPEGSDYELKPEAEAAAGQSPGLRTGKTPETLRDLPTGAYTLALKHPGWPDETRSIQVRRGETLPVEWRFASGSLAVTSDPAGANVYIGDRLLGVTPLAADVAPGDYNNVEVVMDGMVPVTLTAAVQQGETTSLAAGPLQPMVTALQLTSEPAGCDYAISGSTGVIRNGQTPAAIFDLPEGSYTVTFQRAGWPDFAAPANLVAKVPVSLSHEFAEGTISITSEPEHAEIYQGTRLLGIAPVTVTLPPGETELTAKLAGMPQRKQSVTVADGEETSLVFNMKSGGSTTSSHHHHKKKTPPPSALAKFGDSIKAFFSGVGKPAATPKPRQR